MGATPFLAPVPFATHFVPERFGTSTAAGDSWLDCAVFPRRQKMTISAPPNFLQEFSGSTSEPSQHQLRVRYAARWFELLAQGMNDEHCLQQPALETSIRLSKHEVAVILPALQDMVNGIAEAVYFDQYSRRDATHVPYHGEEIYVNRRFDDEMFVHVLSCRNKLKFKFECASKVVGLDALELAATALAFRVVQKQKLVSKEILASPSVAGLECKLENARKRAKRAANKQNGPDLYKDQASRWEHFVEWMRYNLLYYRLRRQSNKHGTRFYKEQRETMRALAMQVVKETADQEHIHHLADLARREIRRRRHEPTVRALLADQDQARQFLADFFLKRDCLELLKPEFVPEALRVCLRAENLKAALRLDED
jgi:hypothetical protein